jgi:hypothetical protein
VCGSVLDDLEVVPAVVAVGVVEVVAAAVVTVEGEELDGDVVVVPEAAGVAEELDEPEVDVPDEEVDDEAPPPEW